MKKVITVLAVLALVAGFAFAATSEQHKITINSIIEEKVPQFQLVLGTTKTNETGTPATAKDVDHAPEGGYSADASTQTGVVDLAGDGTDYVEVVAHLFNKAKSNRTFTLTFSDGVFTGVTTNGASTPVSPSIGTTASTNKGFTVTGAGTSSAAVTVKFNGKTCDAGDIVTAKYTYTQSDNYDPSENPYTADIVLTVAGS